MIEGTVNGEFAAETIRKLSEYTGKRVRVTIEELSDSGFAGNQQLPNRKFLRIDELFAFVAVGSEGEGVCGFMTPGDVMLPMVGADTARVDSLRPVAVDIAQRSHTEIHLLRFSHREEVEIIKP